MNPSIRSGLIAAVLLTTGATTVSAQPWWWPPTNPTTFDPACPHPSAPFDITVSGTWPNSCIPNGSSAQVNGTEIDIAVVRDPPPGICLTVLTPWSRTEQVGPLAAGTYTVFATYYEATTIVQPRVQVGQITVSTSCPAPCYADCNADGALTVADFGCFQTAFVAGNLYADCNGDGLLTVPDFGCFQTRFVAGCP